MLSINCNRKIAKGIGVLNIPAGRTCPGQTALCTKICYAKKAERIYKSARISRTNNYLTAISPEFVSLIVKEIKKHKLLKVRLHESGDFPEQWYLNKIIEIMNKCPETTFLAYTKSFMLDWSCIPSNMMLYYSMDKTSYVTAPAGKPIAFTVAKGDFPPANYKTCRPINKQHYCGTECNICWIGKDSVYFNQH